MNRERHGRNIDTVYVRQPEELLKECRRPIRKRVVVTERMRVVPDRGNFLYIEKPECFQIIGQSLLTLNCSVVIEGVRKVKLQSLAIDNPVINKDCLSIEGPGKDFLADKILYFNGRDECVTIHPVESSSDTGGPRFRNAAFTNSIAIPNPGAFQKGRRHDDGSIFRNCDDLLVSRFLYGPGSRRFPRLVSCTGAVLENVVALGCRDWGSILSMNNRVDYASCVYGGDMVESGGYPIAENHPSGVWKSNVRIHDCLVRLNRRSADRPGRRPEWSSESYDLVHPDMIDRVRVQLLESPWDSKSIWKMISALGPDVQLLSDFPKVTELQTRTIQELKTI